MPSAEQPYHHGNLRAVLVDTAVALARTTGPDGVVLREVARRAGVSHNAAYRHFADRAELLKEVSGYAMAELERAMTEAVDAVTETDRVDRAFARLRETGRAYVGFAVAEPGLFTVAFTAGQERSARLPDPEERSGPYAVLNSVLDELVACGAVRRELREGADVGCWAMVHGFSELLVHGPLRELPDELRGAALESVLDLVQRGLTSRPARSS